MRGGVLVQLVLAACISGGAIAQEELLAATGQAAELPQKVVEAVVEFRAPPPLTLEEAITRALANSPRLKAAEESMLAASGAEQQARAFANPELAVEAENFRGSGPYKGFDSAESTYGVSQLFEVGGKRGARGKGATRERELATLAHQSMRLDVVRDVTVAFAEAVAARRTLALSEEQRNLAEEVLAGVSNRVDAAAEPLFQKSKAEVELATSVVAVDQARREWVVALARLAVLWGESTPAAELDDGAFSQVSEPVLADERLIERNPDYARWDTEVGRSQAALELERANRIPDPSVTVGLRSFRESKDRALVAGVAVPIPVFNANRGNVTKAQHEVAKADSDKQASQLEMVGELRRARLELETAYRRVLSLEGSILPAATKAFELSRQGYQAGRFPYLEVLDAQRTLVDAQLQHVASLKQYHIMNAQVDRLIARHLPATKKESVDD